MTSSELASTAPAKTTGLDPQRLNGSAVAKNHKFYAKPCTEYHREPRKVGKLRLLFRTAKTPLALAGQISAHRTSAIMMALLSNAI